MAAFTAFHVLLSLIGIATGLVVAFGLVTSNRMDRLTAVFLGTTAAKIPALNALAPTQTEPPFAIAQVINLVLFLVWGYLAVRRFHPLELVRGYTSATA